MLGAEAVLEVLLLLKMLLQDLELKPPLPQLVVELVGVEERTGRRRNRRP